MAYLRPLNSSESNLYVMRFNTPDISLTYVNSLTVSNNYITIEPTYYSNPSSDLLPEGFRYMIGDGSSDNYKNYKINFGTMKNPFTDPPVVIINILHSQYENTTDDVDAYSVVIETVTKTGFTFSVRSSTDNNVSTKLTPFTSSSLLPVRFSIFVVGSVVSGATFAISNRGWSVPESSVNKLYTYQSVGVGTGKVDGTFNLKGTMVTPPNKITITSSDFINNEASATSELSLNLVNNLLNVVTIDSSITGNNNIVLPNGYNGQILKISLTNNSEIGEGNSVNIISRLDNPILINSLRVKKYTEFYFDADENIWRLLL